MADSLLVDDAFWGWCWSRLQRRSLFAYMTELLTAHARGDPVPLLT
jgi:hypothetical protein